MPSLGNWNKTENGFEGEILLPGNRDATRLYATKNTNENGPDYLLQTRNGAEVGAAWEKQAERTGNKYLSVSYDNPLETRRIDFNLVDRGNGQWEAIYSRNSMTRSNQAAEQTQEANKDNQNTAPNKTASKASTKETGRTKEDEGKSL